MKNITLDEFLSRMNEVPVKSPIRVLQDDGKGGAVEHEVVDVVTTYDTRKTEIILKIK